MDVFFDILLLVAAAVIVAWLSSRLMGVSMRGWRGLVAGLMGFFAGTTAALFTLGKGTGAGRTLQPHGFGGWIAALAPVSCPTQGGSLPSGKDTVICRPFGSSAEYQTVEEYLRC